MLHGVIMAGGSGTRFWPASRADRPKQLLDLADDSTMIQATVGRLAGLIEPQNTLIVTNQRLVESIGVQLPHLPTQSILGEPCKRDTAPCVGVAAACLLKTDPDATMVVMPADHIIKDVKAFQAAIVAAAKLLNEKPSRLITFGILPTYPAESFGYIERAESIPADGVSAYRVKKFREKPKLEVAKEYVDSGDFYWNAGIFVWRAATILKELETHAPEMHKHIVTISESFGTPQFNDVFVKEFEQIQGKSIDYAVMENAQDVVTVEATFDWDDVGSWQALARLRGVDEHGNTIAAVNHLGIETKGTIVRSENGHLIVTLGVKDCLVVHTKDATLVASKHHEEDVRKVVKLLEEKGMTDFL